MKLPAIYCPNKNCPVVSMHGLSSPKQHGRVVRCVQCGTSMKAKPGKTVNGRKA